MCSVYRNIISHTIVNRNYLKKCKYLNSHPKFKYVVSYAMFPLSHFFDRPAGQKNGLEGTLLKGIQLMLESNTIVSIRRELQ